MPDDQDAVLVLDGRCGDGEVLGGKGAALDQLVSWRFPVPATGVVTTAVYRAFGSHPTLLELTDRIRGGAAVAAEDVDAAFLAVDLPPAVSSSIMALASDVGGLQKLAVRSSANIEDMTGSSFAGQYRTLLNVDAEDPEAVSTAVRLVFASLWHPAPCAYREALGIADDDAAMAAVLMQMVPTRRAGVVFTVDPGGEPEVLRIEAVEGLGESLVSGERTPDAWLSKRGDPEPDLPFEIGEARRLALLVETQASEPQDVEWAWDGAQVWLLQARPITVGAEANDDGFDSHPGDHDLTTAGIGEMLPGVLPPLLWELNSYLVDEAFRRVLDDLGVLPDQSDETHLVRRVRGRAVLDFSRLQHMAAALPGGRADQLEEEYFGSRRAGRAATPAGPRSSGLRGLRHDHRVMRARRHNMLDGEIAIEAVADISRHLPDLAAATSAELLGYRLGLIDLATRSMGAELSLAADAAGAYRRVELLLIPHLGEVEAGRQAELVTSAQGITVLPEPDASAAVFGGPTWRELAQDPVQLGDRAESRNADPLEDLERVLAEVSTWGSGSLRSAVRTRTLRHAVAEAATQLRRREQLKAALLRLGGETRRVHLELGSRLAATGAVPEARDVELLTTRELCSALKGVPPSAATIMRRRRWRSRYENEPPLPVRFSGQPEAAVVEMPEGGRLEGWAASPGQYAGQAQVVMSSQGPFEAGRILVAQATDALWSPLFVKAGAIVLERGGPLSHAAILARELGVPAVLNVAGATQHLDGAELTVDGDRGIVVVHQHAPSGAAQ